MNPDPNPNSDPTLEAGSVSFHNGLTCHAASPNSSTERRRAMTCALMPTGSVFNGMPNVYTEGQMAQYKLGDLLEV